MKTLKVKLLTGRVSSEGSYAPGEELTLPVKEALVLIASNQATPVHKAAYTEAVTVAKRHEHEALEEQAKIDSIKNKQQLQNELQELYTKVVLKVAEIEGIVLNDEEVHSQVKEKMHGIEIGKGK